MTENARLPHVLILSTADWDRPVWTNKQYIAVELAKQFRVTYVESLGLRRPSFSIGDARRIAKKAMSVVGRGNGSDSRSVKPRPDNIEIVSPLVLPFHGKSSPFGRANAALLRRSVLDWFSTPKEQRVLWTFSPVTYGLENEAAKCVYHCVDFLGEFPGVDARAISEGEATLSAKAIALASSRALLEHLEESGFTEPRLWENVADVEAIIDIASNQERTPGSVVFLGNLTPAKVDVELLENLATSEPGITLHLAGPLAEGGGTSSGFDRVLAMSNVEYHGNLEPAEAARLLGRCTVGVVPYVENPYTKGVFPMKVYEYMAAGLDVICTGVPAVANAEGVVSASTAEEFLTLVRESALREPNRQDVEQRLKIASEHSWTKRGQAARELVIGREHANNG